MFKFNRRTLQHIILVMMLGLLVIGSALVVGAQEENVLRVGINAPAELDPALGTADAEIILNRSIYDYLIEIAPDNSLVPNLATDWSVSDDGLTYTFNLVENAAFHDGSPFTAADVVFTYNRLKELESSALALLGDFEVEAVDDFTVQFTLADVNPDFLFGVASRFAAILKDGTESPNVLVEGDNPYVNFNGTGPFVLQDYRPGEQAVLVRNENYWREGEPLLDELQFIYIDDPLAQIDAIRSGTVDVIFRIPLDQVDALAESEGINLTEKPSNIFPAIHIRSDEGYLGEDVRIRQAFKLATDKVAINELLLNGRGIIGNNDPVGPLYGEFYNDRGDANQVTADPEAACALIAETGQERISATLYAVDAFNYADLATVLQQQWEEGCIDVEVLVRPENIYYADNEWLEVELGITGWGTRAAPLEYYTLAWASDGQWNGAHWGSPEADALIAEAQRTIDPERRVELFHQISEIFAEEGAYIIPFFQPVIGAYLDGIEGLDMHPFPGRTDFRQVTVNR